MSMPDSVKNQHQLMPQMMQHHQMVLQQYWVMMLDLIASYNCTQLLHNKVQEQLELKQEHPQLFRLIPLNPNPNHSHGGGAGDNGVGVGDNSLGRAVVGGRDS
jgi:hypothetical protein